MNEVFLLLYILLVFFIEKELSVKNDYVLKLEIQLETLKEVMKK